MRYFGYIRRNGRTRKDEMAKASHMIDLKANGIPKARKFLPFIYKARRITFQKLCYVDLRQLKISLL